MAKSTKTTKPTKANKVTKPAKKVVTEPGVITPEKRAELVSLIVKKYKNHNFIADSFRIVGESKDYPTKRSIEFACPDCKKSRRVATSDIFQVHRCEGCTKIHKKADASNDTKPAKPAKATK